MAEFYVQEPPGCVLPPERAPLGYEHDEPVLLKLVTDHLDCLHRVQDGPRGEKHVADLGLRPVGFVHFNRLWLNSFEPEPFYRQRPSAAVPPPRWISSPTCP
ncbi:hypothetical protein OG259_40695 [Streptomyces sp. NBC_00250]|uniref:hypothetical protein n=1 Tax=Streptomyces sp. NBC_00250 TaxID=2903641 RepID=UPI002E2B9C33|nr:hypothetical protein [Streptomyces sp. NBC_00250]